jgi:cysteinyl-tRNA synthetase
LTQTRTGWNASALKDAAIDTALVESLIRERSAARAAKNWAESDRLRDRLTGLGVALKDNKDGTTTWEPRR